MLGMLEGGVVGIIAKKSFDGQVPTDLLNIVIAFLTGLPAMANLTSFAWAALAHGRHKIRFINSLQLIAVLAMLSFAFATPSTWGFILFSVAVTLGRVAWAGVVTVRSTVWGLNYPRTIRPRIAGSFATVQAICIAAVTFVAGFILDDNPNAYRWLFPISAMFGGLGVWFYSRIRVRGHAELMHQEAVDTRSRPSINPLGLLKVLRSDRKYAAFMMCLFLIGTGNIMVTAPLVLILDEQFKLDYLGAILILTSIPILMMPLSIPIWSRLLSGMHVVRFRSIHSWIFVISNFILFAAVTWSFLPGIYISAVIRGFGFGGGVLAWNLGHHDFTTPERSTQYMGVHVTLTGIRGLLAPTLGISAYEILIEQGRPTAGGVFLIAGLLSILGAVGFRLLGRQFSGPPEDSSPNPPQAAS
tara:strand:- start:1759 stop:3000 length:1242 start_codon:yes stop_codon:yes gene_type:complete